MANAGDGPIAPGKYWIVDRQKGNWLSQKRVEFKDSVNEYSACSGSLYALT